MTKFNQAKIYKAQLMRNMAMETKNREKYKKSLRELPQPKIDLDNIFDYTELPKQFTKKSAVAMAKAILSVLKFNELNPNTELDVTSTKENKGLLYREIINILNGYGGKEFNFDHRNISFVLTVLTDNALIIQDIQTIKKPIKIFCLHPEIQFDTKLI